MFSWLTKCCSNSNSCPFQNALSYSTYADWNAPSQSNLQYAIQCFKGQHKQLVRVQKAFSIFKTKFQKNEQKNNIAFRLKNLLLLDRCTEEICILDLIANYQYNRLFYDRNKSEVSSQNKLLHQFICSYYLYIKKKADLYQRFPNELFNSKSRKFYLNNVMNLGRIFQFIDMALQLQKMLNQTNETLKLVSKSPELIQTILTYLLKGYLFLYTIVAICLQTLLVKLKSLKFSQLNNLDRLLKYFNRDYSNSFLNFLEANKNIPVFKNIHYNEIIKIDQNYLNLFDKYYKLKASQISNPQSDKKGSQKSLSNSPITTNSSLIDSQQLQSRIQQLPNEIYNKLSQQLKFSYQPRMGKQIIISSDAHIYQTCFLDYKNYYSEDFIRDHNQAVVKEVLKQQNDEIAPLQTTIMKKKSSKILKKKSIMEDLINSKSLKKSQRLSKLETRTFKQAKWITFQNVYSQ